jgi:hypothetical protein
MEARRIFQTTLVHSLRPELSIAALFLNTEFAAGAGAEAAVEAVCRPLGIEPMSGGEITHDELGRVLACVLTDSLEVFDMTPRAFQFYVNASGIDEGFLEHALTAARLVVPRGGGGGAQEGGGQGGLATQTLESLLADSLAAGFGFYQLSEHDRLHDVSGRHKIELLFMILPDGLLLAGSQRGLDRALHFGLYERIHQNFIAPQMPGINR